jgi:uncharacterized protein YjiS (DUF1127 family)
MMRDVNITRFTDTGGATMFGLRSAKEGIAPMSGHVLHRSMVRRRPAATPAAVWLAWMAEAMRTVGTRRALAQMDDRMLKDIGLSRAEALEEADRKPWDLGPRGM